MKRGPFNPSHGSLDLCALLVCLGLCGSTLARAQSAEAPPARLLWFTSRGPLLAEVDVVGNGHSLEQQRARWVAEALTAMRGDASEDPPWSAMWDGPWSLLASGRRQPTTDKRQRRQLEDLYDRDRDDRADPAEVLQWLGSQAMLGPVVVFQETSAAGSPTQGAAWRLLDDDGDGQLGPSECQAALDRLRQRDFNQDEWLDRSELATGEDETAAAERGPRRPAAVFWIGSPPDALLAGVFDDHYGLDLENFAALDPGPRQWLAALDRNGNRRISVAELAALNQVPASSRLRIELPPADLGGPIQWTWLPEPPPGVVVQAGSVLGQTETLAQQEQAFLRADADSNGYLSPDELPTASARLGIDLERLSQTLGQAPLTWSTLAEHFQWRGGLASTRLRLVLVGDVDPTWSRFDVSGDGRLSLREMLAAAARLCELDRDGNQQITADELVGRPVLRLLVGDAPEALPPPGEASEHSGEAAPPGWFIAADVNGDGDLSPREFLGTGARFQTLDQNQDGLVDRNEADPTPPAKADP